MAEIFDYILDEDHSKAIEVSLFLFDLLEENINVDKLSFKNKNKLVTKSLQVLAIYDIVKSHKHFIEDQDKEGIEWIKKAILIINHISSDERIHTNIVNFMIESWNGIKDKCQKST